MNWWTRLPLSDRALVICAIMIAVATSVEIGFYVMGAVPLSSLDWAVVACALVFVALAVNFVQIRMRLNETARRVAAEEAVGQHAITTR